MKLERAFWLTLLVIIDISFASPASHLSSCDASTHEVRAHPATERSLLQRTFNVAEHLRARQTTSDTSTDASRQGTGHRLLRLALATITPRFKPRFKSWHMQIGIALLCFFLLCVSVLLLCCCFSRQKRTGDDLLEVRRRTSSFEHQIGSLQKDEQQLAIEGNAAANRILRADTSPTTRLALCFTTTIVHFLVVECRCVFAFYLGFKDTLTKTAVYVYSHERSLRQVFDGAQDRKEVSMGTSFAEYQECFVNDVQNAMSTFNGRYNGVCLDIGWNQWGKLALSMEALVLCLIVVQIILLISFLMRCFKQNDHCTFWSGRYMSFTWSIVRSKAYKFAVYAVVFYSAVAVSITLGATFMHGDGLNFDFLQDNAVALVMTVAAALGLMKNHEPSFAHNSDAFNRLLFNRSLLQMFQQTNDSFAQSFEQALYRASLDNGESLQDLVFYQSLGWSTFDGPQQRRLIAMLSLKVMS